MSAREALIDALLAATPEPPSGLPDDELIAAAAGLVATRDAVLAGVRADDGPLAPPAPAAKIAELMTRQDTWAMALAAAYTRLGAHRVAAPKLRAYRTRQP